jgi:hypothetical protein
MQRSPISNSYLCSGDVDEAVDSGGLEELPQDAHEHHGSKAWNGTYRNVFDYFVMVEYFL